MKDLFVTVPPRGVERLGGCPELIDMPDKRYGFSFRWQPGYVPRPVFIGQVEFPLHTIIGEGDSGSVARAHLFGYRFDLSRASCPDRDLPDGNFIEYVVVEDRDGRSPVSRRLAQQAASVTYSEVAETEDYDWRQPACLRRPPRWKPEDAYWPACDGRPMVFLQQWTLPENEVTRSYLTHDCDIYLFCLARDNDLVFKITTQSTDLQTAEDHYALEDAEWGAGQEEYQ